MKNRLTLAAAIAALLAGGVLSAGLTQPAKKPAASAAQDKNFSPGFDDLMTMLVQPRHIRLYYAGTARNWELAAAENRDLRSSLDRIIRGIPNYESYNVKQAVTTFLTPKLNAMDAGVGGAEPKRFSAAYGQLTTGCNDCHTYMEHPFLVIKAPEGAVDAA